MDATDLATLPGSAASPVRLIIVGAARIAQVLAPMAKLAGLEVMVVDPRPSFATPERFPGIALSGELPEVALERTGIDRSTAVVSLAHDPKLDDPTLSTALRSEAFFVGCLGGRNTQAALRERLRAQGFTEPELARLKGPVGLPIGAASPGEIAVSILAQLVACFRGSAPVTPASCAGSGRTPSSGI
jgi:xanthine dehydrogenase accessory factor